MRRTTFAVIIIAMVVSGYFVFQCTNVVAYNSFSRGIVVATRLVAVEFLNLNHTGPGEGDFALLLTFGNPTTQTLNITAVNALYYIEQGPGSSLAARGNAGGSTELGPGETQFILPMFDSVPQVSAPEHFQCIVYYSWSSAQPTTASNIWHMIRSHKLGVPTFWEEKTVSSRKLPRTCCLWLMFGLWDLRYWGHWLFFKKRSTTKC